MKKPIIVLFLAVLIILAGCTYFVPEETAIPLVEEVPLREISWVDEPFSGSVYQGLYNVVCEPEDRFDDKALQQAVAQIPVNYPITDEESIQTYVWEFYRIGAEHGLFSAGLIPQTAMCFSDGVWEIIFKPALVNANQSQQVYYDGDQLVELLVSNIDGQVIYLEINSNYSKAD